MSQDSIEKIEKESIPEGAETSVNQTEKKKKGGKREGAGRKKGVESQKTKDKRVALDAYKERVTQNMQRLLDAQLALGQGISILYRIDTEIIGSGKSEKRIKKRPVVVTDPEEIANYLDGEFGGGESMNTETEYYYITTERPDNRAIDSMLDRVYGRPQQSIDLKDDKGKGLLQHLAEAAIAANKGVLPKNGAAQGD